MSGDNRVLLGKRGSSDYGLWVSKPGANVLTCDPEDMLIDADREEIVSNPLASGSGTVTFTSSGSNYLNANSGDISYGTTYDYVPILVYCFVDSNTGIVYPMYYEIYWSMNVTTSQAGEPVISTSQGYISQSNAYIYKDKFKLYAKRWWSRASNGTTSVSGFSTGTHTFYWAIFPVGEAGVS